MSHARFIGSLGSLALAAVAALAACGGGSNAEDPKTPSSKSSSERTPMEELESISTELEADVASLTKPIDEIQSVIDDLTNIPKKHSIAAADVSAIARATLEAGAVDVKLDGDLSAEAKTELEAALERLSATVKALHATPEKVAALTTKLASRAAKVPVLATRVTTSASVTLSNPFADASAKAKAQAQIDGAKATQAAVMKAISDAQQKVAGIPQLATGALAKLSASFAGV